MISKTNLIAKYISINFDCSNPCKMAIMLKDKDAVISHLKKDLLRWQGINPSESQVDHVGLGRIEEAFPNGIFPKNSVHEFISMNREESAVSCGFICGVNWII